MAIAGGPGSRTRWLLMERQRSRLVRLLRARGVESADAEDCVQEALVRGALIQSIDLTTVDSLMTVIAVNASHDLHRRQGRSQRLSLRLGTNASAAPDEVAVDRVMATEAAEAARGLSVTERTVVMAAADGFKPRETAELLGLPVDSVHRALYRARRVLRAAAGGAAAWLLNWRRTVRHGLRTAAVGTLSLSAMGLLLAPVPAPATAIPVPHALNGQVWLETSGPSGRHGNAPAVSAPPPRAVAQTTAAPRTAATAPATSRVLYRGQVGAGAYQTPVTVTQQDTQYSLSQSVAKCLQPGGLSLDPHQLLCKP